MTTERDSSEFDAWCDQTSSDKAMARCDQSPYYEACGNDSGKAHRCIEEAFDEALPLAAKWVMRELEKWAKSDEAAEEDYYIVAAINHLKQKGVPHD